MTHIFSSFVKKIPRKIISLWKFNCIVFPETYFFQKMPTKIDKSVSCRISTWANCEAVLENICFSSERYVHHNKEYSFPPKGLLIQTKTNSGTKIIFRNGFFFHVWVISDLWIKNFRRKRILLLLKRTCFSFSWKLKATEGTTKALPVFVQTDSFLIRRSLLFSHRKYI